MLFSSSGSCDPLHQRHRVALRHVIQVQALGSFGLDAHLVDFDSKQVGDPGAHLSGDGPDLRRGQDQRRIDVHDLVAGVLQLFHCQLQKDGRVGVLPARIAGRKEAADIARGNRAQQRVGYRVQQHVAVGVAGQPLGMVQRHPANAQRHARLECVRVLAKSDPCIHDLCGSP